MMQKLQAIPYPEILPDGVELPIAGENILRGYAVRVDHVGDRWLVTNADPVVGQMHGIALESAEVGQPVRVQTFVVGRALSPATMVWKPDYETQFLLVVKDDPAASDNASEGEGS